MKKRNSKPSPKSSASRKGFVVLSYVKGEKTSTTLVEFLTFFILQNSPDCTVSEAFTVQSDTDSRERMNTNGVPGLTVRYLSNADRSYFPVD